MAPSIDPGTLWVRELAVNAIRMGGAEGMRRVANLLAALRELNARGQLPTACEADLQGLEDTWKDLKNEGSASGKPQLMDKLLISQLIRITTGRSDADLLQILGELQHYSQS